MPPQKTKTATTTSKPATTETTKREAKAILSRALASLALSEPWMRAWAEKALATATAEDACAAVPLLLADFADARDHDPAFDDLCRLLDRVADLRIAEKLRAEAIGGDARARAAYYVHARDLIIPEAAGQPAESPLSAEIVEAMLSAGLAAAAASTTAAAPGASPPAPPRAWQSKPR